MAKAEAGAIASQAQGNLAFLAQFFEELDAGRDLDAILARFRAADPEIASRQLGMVSFAGPAVAYTGRRCTPWAGHDLGEGFAIQGNTLAGPQVVSAMRDAFVETSGALHERLYAALAAGDAAGGDLRGRQSARLAVRRRGAGQPGTDALVDIAIEDHADPVRELGRILGVGKTLLEILGHLRAFSRAAPADKPAVLGALRALLDDKRDGRYLDWWESLGMAYHETGDLDRALEAFQIYLEINPRMQSALEAGVDLGTFPADLARRLFATS